MFYYHQCTADCNLQQALSNRLQYIVDIVFIGHVFHYKLFSTSAFRALQHIHREITIGLLFSWCYQRFCCDWKYRAAYAQIFALWQQAAIEFTCHDHSVIACSRHIYLWCCSSLTSRSWWITQSTQHHRKGCNRSNEIYSFKCFLNICITDCVYSTHAIIQMLMWWFGSVLMW